MNRDSFGRLLFGAGVGALGVLDLVFRDTLMWKVLPHGVPGTPVLAAGSGVLLFVAGPGLVSTRFRAPLSRVLVGYLLLWDLLVGVPPLVASPRMEVSWLVFGMMTIVLVAAWLLTGAANVRIARAIVGLALIPVGLSHFFYFHTTLDLVPAWLPGRAFWAYLVGVAHIGAGLGILFGVVPRLAAMAEAVMLMTFAVLVWIPRVMARPDVHFNWTELLGTCVVGAAMWVMADSYAGAPWLPAGRRAESR